MTHKGCPFQPTEGYSTAQGCREWLSDHGLSEGQATKISLTLEADPDVSQPLYFWQLYSLIGHKTIYNIIQNFYERIYADKEAPRFKEAFTQIGTMEYHIRAQAAYWFDVMGGGRHYHGGSYRINFHHLHNASQVMNAAGAKKWMHYMRGALNDQKFKDPRVKPCIFDFLKTKMKRYAEQHGWKFDESDFDFGEKALQAPGSHISLDDHVSDEEKKKEEEEEKLA